MDKTENKIDMPQLIDREMKSLLKDAKVYRSHFVSDMMKEEAKEKDVYIYIVDSRRDADNVSAVGLEVSKIGVENPHSFTVIFGFDCDGKKVYGGKFDPMGHDEIKSALKKVVNKYNMKKNDEQEKEKMA